MEQKLKEFQEKFSGLTENTEELNIDNSVENVTETETQPIEEETSEQ